MTARAPVVTARVSRVLAAAIAIVSAVMAYSLTGHQAIGGHDEGIYLATTRALVETGEYRLINLPSMPLQTKYPPAYSVLLALTSKALNVGSQHARPLKAVNAACLALIVFLTAELASRLSRGSPGATVIAALLAGTSLAFVTYVDLILSDPLFVVLLLAAILLLESRRHFIEFAAGSLLGLATLTRTVGLAAIVGKATSPRMRAWRQNAVSLIPAIFVAAGWMGWSRLHRSPVNPLEEYYVGYSAFVLADVLSHPGFVWRVIAFNVTQYLHSLPGALGAPERLTVIALLVGVGLGLRRAWGHPVLRTVVAMGWCYVVILVGFPYAFTRYLLPAFPIVYALVACAGFSMDRVDGRWSSSRLIGIACAGLLLVANALELRHYASHPENAIHVGFGNYLPFGRDGFLQTAEWLRRHTAVDAKLVSANDTSYFTLTSRRGVRPFPYEPQYLQYGEAPQPSSIDVPGELRHLGIDYVVDDPYLLDLKPYVQTYVNRILQAPGDCWQLVFTSDDRLHRIYQRASRASCDPPRVGGLTPPLP